jgi:Flp pilus assembly pilin Flp
MGTLRRFYRDESGQAITEFMLLLLVTIAIVAFMKNELKRVTSRFWVLLARRIAAPCPSCDSGTEFDL